MKILMGVDFSESSGALVQAIVRQLRCDNTEILVLHVLQQVSQAAPEMAFGYAPEMEGERKSAHSQWSELRPNSVAPTLRLTSQSRWQM